MSSTIWTGATKARIDTLRAIGGDRVGFTEMDVRDNAGLLDTMRRERIDSVMHFAALAYVGESVAEPDRYYDNNVVGSLSVIEAALDAGVGRFIFSSTCASYGEPHESDLPIKETCPQNPVNPYGRSKLVTEWMLRDAAAAARDRGHPFAFAALRYFNVAGADPETRVGEDHRPESHLIPICLEVALGKRDALTIHGTDYPTPDGTCIRDYVHVSDLVDAHLATIEALKPGDARAYNVGIGRGYSVRECLEACRRVTGHPIPENEGPRRPGDPPSLTADPGRIEKELGFKARHTDLDEIIETAWRWYQAYPDGYSRD